MILKYPLILASHSPRRQQLVRDLGIEFTIGIPNVDESYPEDMKMNEIPEYLARKKAEYFQDQLNNEILLSADTIVTLDNEILNKPADIIEASEMLSRLSGRSHLVYTGVCILFRNQYHTLHDKTVVYFKSLDDAEIEYYIKHYMPMDKAGAYGIQEWIGMAGISKITGSYFNVVGLPVFKVYQLLKNLDLIEM
jgi:septum formation protein